MYVIFFYLGVSKSIKFLAGSGRNVALPLNIKERQTDRKTEEISYYLLLLLCYFIFFSPVFFQELELSR